jgi:diaminohydroxyphosphoribosylaminopyrimidine deaminase/5-amino-6-(5-phosphoribosylamino)uracil reductase
LTARPAGPRVASRIVVDSHASLSIDSQLVKSANEAPVIVAVGAAANDTNLLLLEQAGVEVVRHPLSASKGHSESGERDRVDLSALLEELGRRQMTNVLVEGGSRLLGSLFDAQLVDEVHVFIAPRVIGGSNAVPAVGGIGAREVASLPRILRPEIELLDGDVYIRGPMREASCK